VRKVSQKDITKIGLITILGLAALFFIVFWLKGYKFKNYDRFTFYFRNVNGLEEGNALRWNGLKIGVVESVKPVQQTFSQDPLPALALIELGKRHFQRAKDLVSSTKIEDLIIAQEAINNAQLEIALGQASYMQTDINETEFVEVIVVVTTPNVPIGPLNQVTIVPSGLIGEQYIDITTISIDDDYERQYDCSKPRFVVLEPMRLDKLIRVNTESAEAVTNLANRLNALFSDQDAENIRDLLKSTAAIAGDPQFRSDVKYTAKNLRQLTTDFKIWKLF